MHKIGKHKEVEQGTNSNVNKSRLTCILASSRELQCLGHVFNMHKLDCLISFWSDEQISIAAFPDASINDVALHDSQGHHIVERDRDAEDALFQ